VTDQNSSDYKPADILIAATTIKPPIAPIKPHRMEIHHHIRVDPYYWLRDDDRHKAEVLNYLEQENSYTRQILEGTEPMQSLLYNEMIARIREEDCSAPCLHKDFWYYHRYHPRQEYPVYYRKPHTLETAEQLLLDIPKLAEPYDFYDLGAYEVSPCQDILAYAEDTLSRRQYRIRFKNLTTGEHYPDTIENTSADMAWANDNHTLFYVARHPDTLLPYRVYRHVLGSSVACDVLVYEERDDAFDAEVSRSKSGRYVIIGLHQTLSSEYRILDADEPEGEFAIFFPRERNHEYEIFHQGERFLIRSNRQAPNFRLLETPVDKTGDPNAWKELISHRDDVLLEDVEVFANHVVVTERHKGLLRIKVLNGETSRSIPFNEPVYSAYIDENPEYSSPRLRYGYSSLTTPNTIYEYDMASGQQTLLKQDEVVGDFNPADYASERIFAPARDSENIPISLVYRRNMGNPADRPLYLYGYGAYGHSIEASFSSHILSLLDRGFVYAIAHIRGGQEMGRRWYDEGRLFNKRNTFTDYIDVSEFLTHHGYAAANKVFAAGGSAGGLLMGAVVNMRPELYRGIVAHVPFVDVVTTMLDESVPLTTGEYDEWGNPADPDAYHTMLSYSPYDQVSARQYPHMLVLTGLHDSQVQYWEPAKWVAKLRALKTDQHLLLLQTNMEAGHAGASGRLRRYREKALEYAFLFSLLAGC